MEDDFFKEMKVDWTKIPSVEELEFHLGIILGYYQPEEIPAMRARARRTRKFVLATEDCISHETSRVENIIEIYENNGFETHVILQDPLGHKGPTVTCPIGFPFNLPFSSARLRRFNRWICRVHVDIVSQGDAFISVPHIEPDPLFHKLAHLWDTYIRKNTIRGKEAVAALNFLGIE